MLKAVKDSICCFSFTVDGKETKRKPHSVELEDNSIKISLLLESSDIGKIENIKLLDVDEGILFEANAVYYKDDMMGVYLSFAINDISEVVS